MEAQHSFTSCAASLFDCRVLQAIHLFLTALRPEAKSRQIQISNPCTTHLALVGYQTSISYFLQAYYAISNLIIYSVRHPTKDISMRKRFPLKFCSASIKMYAANLLTVPKYGYRGKFFSGYTTYVG
jgi:hypothetical protein